VKGKKTSCVKKVGEFFQWIDRSSKYNAMAEYGLFPLNGGGKGMHG
jgi:hypothetical protein